MDGLHHRYALSHAAMMKYTRSYECGSGYETIKKYTCLLNVALYYLL